VSSAKQKQNYKIFLSKEAYFLLKALKVKMEIEEEKRVSYSEVILRLVKKFKESD